jgi:fucokinase
MRTPDLAPLINGWATLRLGVEVPERVAGWDAVVLTASGPAQAALYAAQLERCRRHGRLPAATAVLVVPDPQGRRVGSGGATLHALARLQAGGPPAAWAGRRILLVHAGGDAKRLPWANVLGKAFVPLPLLADHDEPVASLFDHLLALTAPLAARLVGGGLLVMSGDVLPLCDFAAIRPPTDGAVLVTTPVPLDLAGRHGVVCADADDRVTALLQKASPERLRAAGALVAGGAALLDTGVICFRGATAAALLALAADGADAAVGQLIAAGRELSLYEELVGALVPGDRPQVARHPLGPLLLRHLGAHQLHQHRADDLAFLHLGSCGEYLGHLARDWHGRLARRILARHGQLLHPDCCVIATDLDPAVAVGEGSCIYGCELGPEVQIGSRCLAIGARLDLPYRLPDHHCLWQVPTADGRTTTLVCGVDDNPKEPLPRATFGNRALLDWMAVRQVAADDLWPHTADRCLWQARLYTSDPPAALLAWYDDPRAADTSAWRRMPRASLAELAERSDAAAFGAHLDALAGRLARWFLADGVAAAHGRNLRSLGRQLPVPLAPADRRLLATTEPPAFLPRSRQERIRADLRELAGDSVAAATHAAAAIRAVITEVDDAVASAAVPRTAGIVPGTRAAVALPVRFDLAGGWSDTPPWCLEHPARVLNLAITLGGQRPVAAEAEALAQPRWELVDDDRAQVVDDAAVRRGPSSLADPNHLLRCALELAGCGGRHGISQGIRLRTAAAVPRGSGLGTSSILGAAVLTALERLAGRPADPATISHLVLRLEQAMGTGGGWQDQIGGLYPGAKCITSLPTRPLALMIDAIPLAPATIAELQERLVLVYTGQERLAKNILRIVVDRYLQRDGRVVAAIRHLVELADDGRQALATGRLDELGRILAVAWTEHQLLDPHCSNPAVDGLLATIGDWCLGAKLAGAGGGGFGAALAKDALAAERMRKALAAVGGGVRVYAWELAGDV